MFSQRMPAPEETHTHNPFELDKPLMAIEQSRSISWKWWEPQWMFNRRLKYEAERAQFMCEEMNLRNKQSIRVMYKYHLKNSGRI